MAKKTETLSATATLPILTATNTVQVISATATAGIITASATLDGGDDEKKTNKEDLNGNDTNAQGNKQKDKEKKGGGTPPAPKVDKPSKYVYVYLNHPTGIQFDIARNGGQKYRLLINGNAMALRGKDKGILPRGAYGMTRIERDEWETIKRKYGSMRIFKTGLIFISDDRDYGDDRARDQAELESGFEPAKPEDVDVEKTSAGNS